MCEWHGCYDKPLKGFIVPEAFSHPAKFSLALIERIYDHCLERGYLKRGDRVGDPFGGVATGGIVAAYRGLAWYGVELEPRFVKLAQENIDRHALRLTRLGCPWPVITQGDSRRFAKTVAGVVTSPPYADTPITNDKNYDDEKICRLKVSGATAQRATWGFNKGSMGQSNYGTTAGQIGRLPAGSLDAVATSPPFEDCAVNLGDVGPTPGRRQEISARSESRIESYGSTNGQIGNSKGETYWQAVSAVYRSCFQAIRPGGVICLVVKDYIKAGKRVPLCDDTARLLEHIGFTPLERIHAMLVKERRHADLFNGETVDTTSRKSFFRRLAEKKGSPPIDFEEVLIFQRPPHP